MFLEKKTSTNSNFDFGLNNQNSLENNAFGPMDLGLTRQTSYQFSKLDDIKPNFNHTENFLQNGLIDNDLADYLKSEPNSTTVNHFEYQNNHVNVPDVLDREYQNEYSNLMLTPGHKEATIAPNVTPVSIDNMQEEQNSIKTSTYEEGEEESNEYAPESGKGGKGNRKTEAPVTGVTKKIRNNKKKNGKKTKEDTKNLLRNFGNAQNKFAKDHYYSEELVREKYRKLKETDQNLKIKEFKRWIPTKLENFKQFQDVWSKSGEFADLYREICWDFYEKFAAHYIYSASRMSDENTRKTHQKYVYRFLEGIIDPSKFFYFKPTKN